MTPSTPFRHALRGGGRPQILLLGNGLEQLCGGDDWDRLLNSIDVRFTDGHGGQTEAQKDVRKRASDALPFPLLYDLLATPPHPPARFTQEDMNAEEKRLADMMGKMLKAPIDIDGQYRVFQELPKLGADHIFTTNYSYIPEKAFRPRASFGVASTRSSYRFQLSAKHELHYRLHTGYRFDTKERPVGVWHIHGECSVPCGVVLGHDRYGRLLNRIVKCCGEIDYGGQVRDQTHYDFRSWPELFLFGDVYVLGFGFNDCEFDLWWLLRRKQREKYADGRVYYYDHAPADPVNTHQLLLKAHGVEMIRNEFSDGKISSFQDYYDTALRDITARIQRRRESADP